MLRIAFLRKLEIPGWGFIELWYVRSRPPPPDVITGVGELELPKSIALFSNTVEKSSDP